MKQKLLHLNKFGLITWGLMGLIGAICYFVLFPGVTTYQYADLSLGTEKASQNGIHIAQKLNFIDNSKPTRTAIKQQQNLLESALLFNDRTSFHRHINSTPGDSSVLFPWRVQFSLQALSEIAESMNPNREDETGPDDAHSLDILLAQDGNWLGLINNDDYVPKQTVAPSVLEKAFPGISQYLKEESLSDSLLSRLIIFDRNTLSEEADTTEEVRVKELITHLENGWEFEVGRHTARKIIDSYLINSVWSAHTFTTDSIATISYGNLTAARIFLERSEDFFGKPLHLKADVLPTGALLSLKPIIMEQNQDDKTLYQTSLYQSITGISLGVLIIVISGVLLVLFFKRLRSQIIDLKTSLIISVMASLLLPAIILLVVIKQNIMATGSVFETIFIYLLIVTVTGALGSLIYFLLVSVGESVARQVWADKMISFDLIRNGFIVNKPVGISLVRSVFASFLILGFWAAAVSIVPNLFAVSESSNLFLSDTAVLPILYAVVLALLISSVTTLALFSVMGSQIYKITQNTFLVYLFAFIAFGLFTVSPLEFIPPYFKMLYTAFTGLIFTYIFLNFGVLTTFLALLQFILISTVDTGWVLSNSPDLPIFITSMLIPAGFISFGLIAITKGKTEQMLPRYVPEYVEELAQKNRMHQELEIAKEVQASFLPRQMPRMAPLDVAAICHPAYETGGDYFDVIQLDENRMALAIGDVSGKGIQAAFYMTLAKGIIHSLCHEVDNPSDLLARANDIFYRNSSSNTFISMIYGVFDVRNNTFCFARAGHNPILIKRKQSSSVSQIKPSGLGLGMIKGQKFRDNLSEEQITLNHGDTLILFTDGLNEALNQQHEFYGMDRILKLVGSCTSDTSEKLLTNIKDDIITFMGEEKQHDDLTLVILKLQRTDDLTITSVDSKASNPKYDML